MDWWTRIRRKVKVGGVSKRQVMREEGIHWRTLEKMLTYSEPPGYRLKKMRARPKIGPYFGRIQEIIKGDAEVPKKQRHTAKRIYERIEMHLPKTMPKQPEREPLERENTEIPHREPRPE